MDQSVTFETVESYRQDSVTISDVTRQPSDPIPDRFPHLHNLYELIVFKTVQGQLITEHGRCRLSAPCAVWIPKMVVHDFAIERGVSSWTLIQYIFPGLEQSANDRVLAASLSEQDVDRLKDLIAWLRMCAKPQHHEEARSLITLMTAVIARSVSLLEAVSIEAGSLHKLKPALMAIHTPCRKAPPLSEAAALCSLSPSYFSRMFHQMLGTGYAEYCILVRLKRAALDIAASQKSFKTISHENGFHQPAYFSAQFKKHYGMTPSNFRSAANRYANAGRSQAHT